MKNENNQYRNEDNHCYSEGKRKRGRAPHGLIPLFFILLHLLTLMFGVAVAMVLKVGPQLLRKMILAGNGTGAIQELLYDPDINNGGSIVAGLILIPLFYSVLKSRQRIYPDILLCEQATTKQVVNSQILLFGAQGLSIVWLLFLHWFQQYSDFIRLRIEQYEVLMGSIVSTEQNVFLMIIATSVVVPFLEELLYRGIVLGELRQLMDIRLAVLVQALLFSLVHGNFIQSVYAFVLALVIAYIYLKSKSFALCVLSHMVFNFIGGALPQLIEANSPLFSLLRVLQMLALIMVVVYIPQQVNLKKREANDVS